MFFINLVNSSQQLGKTIKKLSISGLETPEGPGKGLCQAPSPQTHCACYRCIHNDTYSPVHSKNILLELRFSREWTILRVLCP